MENPDAGGGKHLPGRLRGARFLQQTNRDGAAGKITLQPAANSNGLLLLERAETDKPAPFSWQNATVYFVLTDRFVNGDPTNDNSYGRHKDGMQEIGTFHGGDLKGLASKLDYLQQLGVNAL